VRAGFFTKDMAQTLELKILLTAETGTAQRAIDAVKSSISNIGGGLRIDETAISKPFDNAAKSAKDTATATKSIDDAAKQAATGAGSLLDKFSKIGLQTAGITSLANNIEGLSKPFAELDSGLRAIGTLGVKNFAEFGDAALELSRTFPDNAATIANAVADAVGSGIIKTDQAGKISIQQAKGFAEQASSLALAGATDIGKATSGLASVMNSYGDSLDKYGDTTKKAAFVSDVLFNTYNLGVTTVSDLASNLSNVTGLAATAGVGIDQVGAAIATMTKQGKQTGVATTQIRGLIQELLAGKDKLAPVLADLQNDFAKQEGVIASTGRAYDKTRTLQQNLKDGNITLQDVAAGIGKVAAKQGKEVTNIFGSVEAASAVLSLSGKNAKVAFEDLEGITARGTVAAGVDVQAGSIENRMKVLINTVNSGFVAAFSKLGDGATVAIGAISKLAPTISAVTGIKQLIPESVFTSLASNAKALGGAFVGAFKDFGGTVLSARIGIASFAGNITQAILPAIARIAPTLVVTNAAGALSFAGLSTAATAAWTAVTGPVGLVVAGIAAVGVAAVLLYKNFEPFRNFVDGVWAGIVKAFNDAKPVVAELGKLFSDIGGFIKDTFVGALNGAFDIIRGVGSAVGSLLILAFEKLSVVLSPVAGFFRSIGSAAASFVSSLFKTTSATDSASAGLKGFEGVLGSVRAGLVNVRAFVAGLAGGLEVLGKTLSSIATNLLNPSEWGKINVSGFFDNFQKAFTGRWNQTWEDAKKTAQTGAASIGDVEVKPPDTEKTASALEALRQVFGKIKTDLANGANTTQVSRDLKNLFNNVNKTQKQGKISLIDASSLENEIQTLLKSFKKGTDGKDKSAKEGETIEKSYTDFIAKQVKLREEIEAATNKSIAEGRIKALEDAKAALEKNELLSSTERLQQTIAIEKQILEERKKTATQAVEEESKKRQATIGADLAALLDKATKLGAASIAEFTNKTANLTPEKIGDFLTKNAQLTKAQIDEITTKVKETSAAIEAQNAEVTKKTTSEFDTAAKAIEARLKSGSIAAALQDQLRAITQTVTNETQKRLQTEQAQLTDKYRSDLLQLEIAEVRKTAIQADFAAKRLAIENNATLAPDVRAKQLAELAATQAASLQEFEGLESAKLGIAQAYTAKQQALQVEQFQATGTIAREQVTALGSTLGALTKGFAGLGGTFAKRSEDYDTQATALKKRLDEELAAVGKNVKKRREIEKKYVEDKKKLDAELGAGGTFKALGDSAADVFGGIAAQQRAAFAESIAGVKSFADIGEQSFLRIGVAAGATLAQAVLQGKDASKAILGVAFDTLNSLVPVLVAQIFGQSFAQLGPVGGAIASGASIAAFTALIAIARSAAGFREGGLVTGGKHDGTTGKLIRINEVAPEFVVNHRATERNLTALTEINRRNITVEQYVRERSPQAPIDTHLFVDEEGVLREGLRRVERAVYDQTDRLESRLVSLESEMHGAAQMYSYERKRTDVVISTKDPNLATTIKERKALH
jgi:TP901 family phage tail tape measure protein